MRKEEIKKMLLDNEKTKLKEDDFFDSSVFYYMAGYFPSMSISKCVDIVTEIRRDILGKTE